MQYPCYILFFLIKTVWLLSDNHGLIDSWLLTQYFCICVYWTTVCFIMATLWNIFLSCGFFYLSIYLLFFLAYSQLLQIGCLLYFHTWCGLSANLGCRSATCFTRLPENTGRKKSPKISPSVQHCTTLSSYIFTSMACIANPKKKLFKKQYLPHVSLQYGELRPTSSCNRLASLGHPSKFQRVSHLGSVTARHSSSGRQPNFAVLNRWPTCIRQGGHHVGYWPTF